MAFDLIINPVLEKQIRDVVGTSYDRRGGPPAERQNRKRPLSVCGVGCAYQFASHVMVGLCGTPSRGAILIRVQCEPTWAYDTYASRMLPDVKREILLQFLWNITGVDPQLIPFDFYWRQERQLEQ